jgi:aminopeptidase-like protein
VPVDITLSLEELKKHLYSIPDKPSAIPYITSYYEKRWGFCISHQQLESLNPGKYRAVVKSTLKPGFLTYGEILLPGLVDQEILFSTYVCHPSLANNEISGPVVTAALARWLSNLTNRRNTYRIVFGPETIGPIVYLSRHLEHLKKKVIAGFNVTCVGDNRAYSFLASRNGDTLADRTAKHVLRHMAPNFLSYSFLKRGSDERQYCAPGIDLPFVSIMRSKYGDYPEYHTSDDNLKVISPEGLGGAFRVLSRCVEVLELNDVLSATVLCEPQLGRRNLISNLGYGPNKIDIKRTILSHLLAYCDGNLDLVDIADMTEIPLWEMSDILANLKNENLLASS